MGVVHQQGRQQVLLHHLIFTELSPPRNNSRPEFRIPCLRLPSYNNSNNIRNISCNSILSSCNNCRLIRFIPHSTCNKCHRDGNCKIIQVLLRKSVQKIYLSGTIFACPGLADSQNISVYIFFMSTYVRLLYRSSHFCG